MRLHIQLHSSRDAELTSSEDCDSGHLWLSYLDENGIHLWIEKGPDISARELTSPRRGMEEQAKLQKMLRCFTEEM